VTCGALPVSHLCLRSEKTGWIAERAIVLRRGKRVGEVDIVAEGPACHENIVKMLM